MSIPRIGTGIKAEIIRYHEGLAVKFNGDDQPLPVPYAREMIKGVRHLAAFDRAVRGAILKYRIAGY